MLGLKLIQVSDPPTHTHTHWVCQPQAAKMRHIMIKSIYNKTTQGFVLMISLFLDCRQLFIILTSCFIRTCSLLMRSTCVLFLMRKITLYRLLTFMYFVRNNELKMYNHQFIHPFIQWLISLSSLGTYRHMHKHKLTSKHCIFTTLLWWNSKDHKSPFY